MGQTNETLLKSCADISTSTWSDAMDDLGIAGVVQGITPRGHQDRFAAFAVTARHLCGDFGDLDRADFAVGRLVEATGPGRALMIDVGGAAISTFGGIASMAASRRGATAVIIDGACRDVNEVKETGLWLASRHVTPLTGKGRLKLISMGKPIMIGGVHVCEGDLVVGDDTGIIVVPRQRLEETLEVARQALAVDLRVEQDIHNGSSFAEAAAAAGYIPASR